MPPLEKILEIAVYNQLLEHIDKNGILMANQSGFRQKHSCESLLQFALCKFKTEVDNNKYVIAVFLDLKRAFETIDRNILLTKLNKYGIEGNAHKWLANYLGNRKQRVKVRDSFSGEIVNDFGVLQGSVLGPLLFILYLNDINILIDCEFINLFADDTLLACSDSNLELAVQKMNVMLSKVENYLNSNKLKLNVSKTKAMIITTKFKFNNINLNNINLSIYNEQIEIVTAVKYLGFQLDNILSFDAHIYMLYEKYTDLVRYRLNLLCSIVLHIA